MKQLAIAKDFSVPLDAVTQTFSEIGRKGAGKTYLATMIAEQMLDADAQVVAIDPVGNWFGLRIDADGRSPGKEIFVIGGEHGDVPLVPEAGARIARLLVEKRISAVLDVSAFRQGERKRFAADFAEEFFHLKKSQRSPVHIFIEEAQLFIPQRVGPDEARMVGAWESIVRLGRNYGIGASLVTQRPQSVNKEVLSQVECLFVLQVNGTHERKALEDWVQEAGADRELVGRLPGLARGVGFVWSPSWLRTFRQLHFAKKTTFDASATPEVGREAKAARLSPMDVEALKSDLTEVVQSAERDDPKALRRRIAELERQAAARPAAEQKVIERPVLKDAQCRRLEGAASTLEKAVRDIVSALVPLTPVMRPTAQVRPVYTPVRTRERTYPIAFPSPTTATNGALPPGERAVLEACIQYPAGVRREQLTVLTGYKRSSRDSYIARLAARGFVRSERDRVEATAEGVAALPDAQPLPTGPALQRFWMDRLPVGEKKILEFLVKAYPEGVARWELDQATGYKRSSRDSYIARLAAKQLVKDVDGGVIASEDLFG